MNKTVLKTVLIAAAVVWVSNNVEPAKNILGERSGGGLFG